ncbi:MAG: hypothetical protein V4650_08360 [Pseudomonadota bacterium]
MSQHYRLPRLLASLLLAAAAVMGPAKADDVDIYIDTATLPQQAPLTALALDLSVANANTVVCDNVLLATTPNCLDIQSRLSIGELTTLLGVPLPSPLTPIIGGLNPATLISDLNVATRTLLSTALGLGAIPLTNQQAYVLAVQQIITSLVDSRLTILLNHNDRAGTGVCAFADLSSLPAPRQDTVGCSNGAYLFTGLTNLADPLQLVALLRRVALALLPSVTNPTAVSIFSANHPYQTKEIYAELAKYLRGDDIYNGHLGVFDYGDNNAADNLNTSFPLLSWDASAEVAGNRRYQSGLAAFPQACTINLVHVQLSNAARQNDSDTAVQTLFPGVDGNSDGAVTVPELVTTAQDSGFVFGADDRRRIQSRFVVQENLFTNGDLSELDQLRSVGGNVTTYSNVIGLLGRGQSIAGSLIKPLSIDTSLISLSIAASRTASTGILQSAYLPVFRADPNQRPDWPGNIKRFRLRNRADVTGQPKGQFDVVDARDSGSGAVSAALGADGRIRSTALSVWTNATQLGAGIGSDGAVADLGGAGQRIPGYQFNGGGNPGRSNAEAIRTVYYDSRFAAADKGCTSVPANNFSLCALNPDDAGVRTELLAATGATAFIAPVSTCATSCNAAAGVCGLACGVTQTACGTSCGVSATACNLLCLPGTVGNSCRNSCTTAQNTCNTGCSTAAATCNSNCGSTETQCLTTCGATPSSRTADTVTRELLLHARGFNVGIKAAPAGNGPADSRTNTGVTSRKWMLGAVLHSRPVAINYGRRNGSTTDVVRVVYGSADGMLHMIDDDTGVEQWAFMPQAVMGSLSTLRENNSGSALPFGVDGSPVVLIRDRAPTTGALASRVTGIIGDVTGVDGDRVLLFFGLRRGGAAYYALDITEPASPRMVWRITTEGLLREGQATVDAGTAALYAPLALAFSTPQVGRVRVDLDEANLNAAPTANTDLNTRSVLFFGGGYNGGRNGVGARIGKDLNNSKALTPLTQVGQNDGVGTTDRGTALYMIDAATGQMLWRAVRGSTASYSAATRTYTHPRMEDSIASDVTAVDTNNDTFTDRLYVGDTGGRLWRADFSGILASTWTMTPVASVGRHNRDGLTPAATIADDRRIFFAPDYVPIRNTLNNSGSDIVLFGTGDREDVLNLATPNWFYGFRDQDLVSGKSAAEIITTEDALPKHTDFRDVTTGALVDVSELTTGYRFSYGRSGEKQFSAPVTLGGQVTFTSYVPPDPASPTTRICTPNEGVSRLYSIGVRKSEFRVVNNTSSAGRDIPLATGLPGEINVLSGTAQAAGGQVFSINAKDKYRASWRERLGETQK